MNVAEQVRVMAKQRRLTTDRMILQLIKEGLEVKRRKEKASFEQADRFRAVADPNEVEQLGDKLGRIVFGK
jgi:hypothetical protein